MKIKILTSANQDLIDGYWFYEKQTGGSGLSSESSMDKKEIEIKK